MEAKARIFEIAKNSKYHKCKKRCLPCCFKQNLQTMEFEGKMLKVEDAPEPSLILWENLGVGKCEWYCRIFVNIFVSFVLIICSISVIVLVMNHQHNTKSLDRDCDSLSE